VVHLDDLVRDPVSGQRYFLCYHMYGVAFRRDFFVVHLDDLVRDPVSGVRY